MFYQLRMDIDKMHYKFENYSIIWCHLLYPDNHTFWKQQTISSLIYNARAQLKLLAFPFNDSHTHKVEE